MRCEGQGWLGVSRLRISKHEFTFNKKKLKWYLGREIRQASDDVEPFLVQGLQQKQAFVREEGRHAK